MHVHTAIFGFYILVTTAMRITWTVSTVYESKRHKAATIDSNQCRCYVASEYLSSITRLNEASIVILFTYMSVKFCRPISASILSFLETSEHDHTLRTPPNGNREVSSSLTNSERAAERYHRAAIRDADIVIDILQAFVKENTFSSQRNIYPRGESLLRT